VDFFSPFTIFYNKRAISQVVATDSEIPLPCDPVTRCSAGKRDTRVRHFMQEPVSIIRRLGAAIFYGAAQFTRDTDLCIFCDAANIERVRNVLGSLNAVQVFFPPLEMQYRRELEEMRHGRDRV
jgi:hypothetical protein